MNLTLKKIKLNLKVNWKISRNESLFKENYILSNGAYFSEIAPNIRYGETAERIEKEFLELQTLNTLEIKAHWSNSFKNAVSNLILKINSKNKVSSYLQIPSSNKIYKTSYSIPMMDTLKVKDYLENNKQYESFKLKIKNNEDLSLLEEVVKYTNRKIRIDANEGFESLESYLSFQEKIKDYNIEFIEQPFKANEKELYKKLKPLSLFEIIADESVEEDFNPEEFCEMFHGVNIKLMKAGGIENGLHLLQKAKKHNLKMMIGCMIETSLGISEALYLADFADYLDLDGALLISNDPFKELVNYNGSNISLKESI